MYDHRGGTIILDRPLPREAREGDALHPEERSRGPVLSRCYPHDVVRQCVLCASGARLVHNFAMGPPVWADEWMPMYLFCIHVYQISIYVE